MIRRSASAADTSPIRNSGPRSRLNAPAGMDEQLLLDTILNNMSQGVLMFDHAAG